MIDAQRQAEVLNQALPYIQAFRGHTFVVKVGGSAMTEPEAVKGVVRNVLLLQIVGIKTVVVHGGGPEIDRWLDKLGMQKATVDGLRVTDEATMEVVEMALAGRANKQLVAQFEHAGGKALGLSGRDGGILKGESISPALGRVGRIVNVNPEALNVATEAGFVPVVCSVASDSAGEALNVNADSAAASIAVAIGATKLILLSDTDGVLADASRPDSRISTLPALDATEMIRSGAASRGMIPKLQAAVGALEGGVKSVHVLNGATSNAILVEVFTHAGIGTMIHG